MDSGLPEIALKKKAEAVKTVFSNHITALVLIVGIIEPLMTIPQIYKIWIEHQTAGLSIWTWSFYVVGGLVWLGYGLKLKDKPLLITASLWTTVQLAVVVGIFVK